MDPLLERGREHLSDEAGKAVVWLFQTIAETVCGQLDALHDDELHRLPAACDEFEQGDLTKPWMDPSLL